MGLAKYRRRVPAKASSSGFTSPTERALGMVGISGAVSQHHLPEALPGGLQSPGGALLGASLLQLLLRVGVSTAKALPSSAC